MVFKILFDLPISKSNTGFQFRTNVPINLKLNAVIIISQLDDSNEFQPVDASFNLT
jgi:hypothetical protein